MTSTQAYTIPFTRQFDVAGWVLTRDSEGKVIGGSADGPADAKANCTAAPEYVGFRVVRGAAKPAAQAQ